MLHTAVLLAESGEQVTRIVLAKDLPGGSCSLVIVQWYARQDPVQHIVRQGLEWPAAAAPQRPRRDRVSHRSSRNSCTNAARRASAFQKRCAELRPRALAVCAQRWS